MLLEEAVELHRLGAEADDAFLPGLAEMLANLGGVYLETGRWRQGLPSTEEAIMIYRRLVGPDSAPPGLAAALSNLGAVPAEARRGEHDLRLICPVWP